MSSILKKFFGKQKILKFKNGRKSDDRTQNLVYRAFSRDEQKSEKAFRVRTRARIMVRTGRKRNCRDSLTSGDTRRQDDYSRDDTIDNKNILYDQHTTTSKSVASLSSCLLERVSWRSNTKEKKRNETQDTAPSTVRIVVRTLRAA
jgi:hypothetical protein